MAGQALTFGPFRIDPGNGTLFRNGTLLPVGQKGAALLVALIRAPGEVLTKAQLMDSAWPGMAVEESNLSVQIAALRKALGPAPDGGDWIVTVPRVGYRLLTQLTAKPAATPAPPALFETVIPSLAVLPFVNLSGDPEQDYFADGIVEDIITALSRFKSFAVIARNSSFVYKDKPVDVRQVCNDLGVRYVLEGSIRRAGNRLRISAQLVEGVTGGHLWAQKFDGAQDDLFAFQDSIADNVVSFVEPNIQQAEIERSRRERPQSLEAYDLYLKTLPRRWEDSTPGEAEKARELLSRALAIEPTNATYLAMTACSMFAPAVRGWTRLDADSTALCISYIERALRSAGENATVLSYCALTLAQGLHEYQRGFELARYAVVANPNDLYAVNVAGVTALHFGDLNDAQRYFHRSIRLSPHGTSAPWSLTGLAHTELARGNFAEALQWAEKAIALNPRFIFTYWMLIAANAQLGRMEEAQRWLKKCQALAPDVTIASIREGEPEQDPSRMSAILEGLRLAGLD